MSFELKGQEILDLLQKVSLYKLQKILLNKNKVKIKILI